MHIQRPSCGCSKQLRRVYLALRVWGARARTGSARPGERARTGSARPGRAGALDMGDKGLSPGRISDVRVPEVVRVALV